MPAKRKSTPKKAPKRSTQTHVTGASGAGKKSYLATVVREHGSVGPAVRNLRSSWRVALHDFAKEATEAEIARPQNQPTPRNCRVIAHPYLHGDKMFKAASIRRDIRQQRNA